MVSSVLDKIADHMQCEDDLILSIVIVDSDSLQLTLKCLVSIFQNPPSGDFEVILVDNCSNQSCSPVISKYYPKVRNVLAPQRQGFSRNYNLGIQQAIGEYVLILNNDTLVHPEALNALLEMIRQDNAYGMVGPRLIGLDGRTQAVCARSLVTPMSYILSQLFFDKAILSGRLFERLRSQRLDKRSSGPVPCISGACMLVSRQALEKIGLLDEDYDFYFEDVEWCHRFQKHGFQVGYVAEAVVTHLGDQSISKIREWAKKSEYLCALRYFRQYHALTFQKAKALWLASIVNFRLRKLVFHLNRESERARIYKRLLQWIHSNPPTHMDYNK